LSFGDVGDVLVNGWTLWSFLGDVGDVLVDGWWWWSLFGDVGDVLVDGLWRGVTGNIGGLAGTVEVNYNIVTWFATK